MSNWVETDTEALPEGAVAPMQQHTLYARAVGALGTPTRRFALWRDDSLLATAQIILRHWPLIGRTAYLARGPVWCSTLPDHRRRQLLSSLLRQLRQEYRAVLATPDPIGRSDPLSEDGGLAMVSPATLAVLDLAPKPDQLRARLKQKWRNRLNRAEAARLFISEDEIRDAPYHWLLRHEAIQARTRRYRRLPDAFTLSWARWGGASAARLFTASENKTGPPIAAMLFLRHGAGASYHIGWSGPDGRAAGAHTLLMWHAMLRLREMGVKALDLDLIDTEGAAGLARFKLGTGAEAVTLGATRLSAPLTRLFSGRARAAMSNSPRPRPQMAGPKANARRKCDGHPT
ncbi:MAG: GNAT family N-acetyltransferase [Pseudomonadota bacterium]